MDSNTNVNILKSGMRPNWSFTKTKAYS